MLVGKKWRNIENIRGKRGGEKLKNAEMRGINNNMRCFEISAPKTGQAPYMR